MNGPNWLDALALNIGYLLLACLIASVLFLLVVWIPVTVIDRREERRLDAELAEKVREWIGER